MKEKKTPETTDILERERESSILEKQALFVMQKLTAKHTKKAVKIQQKQNIK